MAANEFEKNVRKEMDEFKVQPSGEVWSKIEDRIRETKRKRRTEKPTQRSLHYFGRTIFGCTGKSARLISIET